MKLFVGNLPFKTSAEDLKKVFDDYGTVLSVDIVEDSKGNSRGFGFVEMTEEAEGHAAITGLNGSMLDGRTINVSPALIKPKIARRGEGRRSRNYQMRQQRMREREEERGPREYQGGREEYRGGRPEYRGIRKFRTGKKKFAPTVWVHRVKRPVKPWRKDAEERREGGRAFAKSKPWDNRKRHGAPFYKKFHKHSRK